MAMKKTNKSEGKLEVLRGPEAEVLNQHFARTGKYAVSDFSDDERAALDESLNEVRADNSEFETRGLDEDGGDK
jgi:hypothetical protein